MVLDTDFHNHIVRSSALQMVEAAKAKGLRVLGLSEHDFQIDEIYPLLTHMPLEGPRLSTHDYIEQVYGAARQVQFDVRLGLEVDFIPEKQEQIAATLRDQAWDSWDYLIGSVHQIGDNQFESARPTTIEEGEALWLQYFQLLRAAVNTQFFSVISHPVRMRSENPYLPPTLDSELEQLAAEAARNDIALEINGYDTLTYPEVVSRLARACKLHHTPISVGSDAHGPHQVAQAHVQTEKLLHEVGINKVRIWKNRIPEEYTI